MIMPTEHAFVMERDKTLFKVPDDEHSAAQIEQRFARYFGQHEFVTYANRQSLSITD